MTKLCPSFEPTKAKKYGKGHYVYIVLLHTMFIISMIVEYIYKEGAFNLYFTAIIFTVLNSLMLTIRIKEEEKAWAIS